MVSILVDELLENQSKKILAYNKLAKVCYNPSGGNTQKENDMTQSDSSVIYCE